MSIKSDFLGLIGIILGGLGTVGVIYIVAESISPRIYDHGVKESAPAPDVDASTEFGLPDVTSEHDISTILSPSFPAPTVPKLQSLESNPLAEVMGETVEKLRAKLNDVGYLDKNQLDLIVLKDYGWSGEATRRMSADNYRTDVLLLAGVTLSYGVQNDYYYLPGGLPEKEQADTIDYQMHRTLFNNLLDNAYKGKGKMPAEAMHVAYKVYEFISKPLDEIQRPELLMERIFLETFMERFPESVENFMPNPQKIQDAAKIFQDYLNQTTPVLPDYQMEELFPTSN